MYTIQLIELKRTQTPIHFPLCGWVYKTAKRHWKASNVRHDVFHRLLELPKQLLARLFLLYFCIIKVAPTILSIHKLVYSLLLWNINSWGIHIIRSTPTWWWLLGKLIEEHFGQILYSSWTNKVTCCKDLLLVFGIIYVVPTKKSIKIGVFCLIKYIL